MRKLEKKDFISQYEKICKIWVFFFQIQPEQDLFTIVYLQAYDGLGT